MPMCTAPSRRANCGRRVHGLAHGLEGYLHGWAGLRSKAGYALPPYLFGSTRICSVSNPLSSRSVLLACPLRSNTTVRESDGRWEGREEPTRRERLPTLSHKLSHIPFLKRHFVHQNTLLLSPVQGRI